MRWLFTSHPTFFIKIQKLSRKKTMKKSLHKILLCCLVLLSGTTQKIIASSSDLIINARASLLAAANCLSNPSITKSYTDNQLANRIEMLGKINNILTSHATTINDADIIVFLNNTNSLITALHTIATNNNASNTTIVSTPSCILTIGTLLSNIAYNTNLASLDNCGNTVINLINLLDILAPLWSIPTASLNSTDSNVYNSLKNNNNTDSTTWYVT